jgi:hypothetical protein
MEEPALVEPDPAPQPEPVVTKEYSTDRDALEMTTNQLTMYISGGLALVMTTSFFAWAIFSGQTNDPVDSGFEVSQITSQTAVEIVTVDPTFTSTSLRSTIGQSAYNEIVLVNNEDELLPAALVFKIISPALPTNIQQLTTDARFVQYGTVAPQMILSVVDPTSVAGTLLVQEQALAQAMAPLYGNIEAGTFTDQTIRGIDVRVLISGNKQTLTYGIIHGEVLVITASPEVFAEVSALVAN